MITRVLFGLVALLMAAPLLAAAAVTGGQPTAFGPSGAVGEIPPDRLVLYEQAAARFGIDWAVLAAIGKLECDHGRSLLAGCTPPGSVNSAGATGPMQFLGPTWRAGSPLGSVPVAGPPTRVTSEGYATDGDGDGIADVWNAADAIASTARYLQANGVFGDERRAILAYNHAGWYADKVLAQAAEYRALASAEAPASPVSLAVGIDDPVAWAATFLGTPYVWGGNHASAAIQLDPVSTPVVTVGARDGRAGLFDCSSLASWAFAQTRGVWIGGTSEEQWALARQRAASGEALVRTTPPPGGYLRDDLVFFEPTAAGPGHVAIAIDATRVIESPHTGANVRISLIANHGGLVGVARYPQTTTAGGSR